MKRAGWVVLFLLFALTVSAAAQSDCGCADVTEPSCYQTFRSTDIIGIDIVVPGEYFAIHNTFETPLVTGWRVETLDGLLVKYVSFAASPKGHNESFTWDLTADDGHLVGEGFYRIVVSTTSTADVEAYVKILSCCCTPCWGCCGTPCICQLPDTCRSTCCGEPYLTLFDAGSRSCCTFGVTIYGGFEEP